MGSKTQTVTQNSDPWKPAQPYLLDTMNIAQNLYRNGQSTVAPFDPLTTQGINRAAQVANQPVNPIVGQASTALGSTIAGDWMNGNPYLDKAIARGSEGISDRVNSMFSSAGRYGSGAHQGVLGDALADYDMGMRYQNYSDERQNMLRATQLAPSFAQQQQQLGMFGPQALIDLGGIREGKDQAYRMEPYNMLSNFYSPIVHGTAGLGGTSTQQSPAGSRLGGAIGGGLSGAMAGSMLGPVGMIGGGLLGALGGLF